MATQAVKAHTRADGTPVRAHQRRDNRTKAAVDTEAIDAARAAAGSEHLGGDSYRDTGNDDPMERLGAAEQFDAGDAYRERKRRIGIEPSARTVAAARLYAEVDKRRKEHLGNARNIPGEGGGVFEGGVRRLRKPPLSDWQQQSAWLEQMKTQIPDRMALNVERDPKDESLILTLEGPDMSASECCSAGIRLVVDDRGRDASPHRHANSGWECSECGSSVTAHELARYHTPNGGGLPPKLGMPDMDKFAEYATTSRRLLNDVLVSHALIAANERLDEFVERGRTDDVITGEIHPESFQEGETGIRFMPKAAISADSSTAFIQGLTVVDTHEGKRAYFTSPVEVDRNDEPEQR